MTLRELEMVRKAIRLAEHIAIDGNSDFFSDNKKAVKNEAELNKMLNVFEDGACAHDWTDFGKTLKRCKICKTIRKKLVETSL